MPLIRKGGRSERRIRKLLWGLHHPKTVENFGILLPLDDPAVTPPIARDIYFGGYERQEAEVVSARLAADDVVMEIGAGMGFLSALAARRIGSERVHAYEANPAMLPVIARTHALNGVAPTVVNALLGEGDGEAEFVVEEDFWASSSLRRSEQGRQITIPRRDLNGELRRIAPSFLIVDIEGGEGELFRLADLAPVRKICLEVHAAMIGHDGCSEVFQRLFAAGFVLDFGLVRKDVFYFFRPEPRP